MVEKPAVLFPKDAEKIITELEKTNLKFSSNLILRKSPRFLEVKKLVNQGDLGSIFHIEGDYLHHILWKITEGWRGKLDFYCTVYGGGIHLIDLMRWIMNEEVNEVCAVGTSIPTSSSNYKWPDTITSLFKWENGATGKCTTSFAPIRTKFHSLNIYGTKKTFVNDLPHAKYFVGHEKSEDEIAIKTPYPGVEKGDMLPDFIESITKNKLPNVNQTDIFRVMSVCFAIWDSIKLKKTVKVNNII